MRVKARYIAASLIVIVSITATPSCIEAAYQIRGCRVIGGEYLLIPIGLIVAYIIIEIANTVDEYQIKKRRSQITEGSR